MDAYYSDDSVTIYHGDCRDILPALRYDSVVTDPPYGVNQEYRPHGQSTGIRADWDATVPYELLPSFGDVPVVWMGAATKMREAVLEFDPPPDRCLIWTPRFTLSVSASNGIAHRYHLIHTWRLPKQTPTVHDVFTDPTECGNWWSHQATKPLNLMRRLVALTEATVCDPFMGSGTTLRAAKDLGRKAVGIELDESYCEIAAKRMSQGVLAVPAIHPPQELAL